jgi:hypothetical protein
MNEPSTTSGKRGRAMEILIPVLFLAGWIFLQAWVLPRFGVRT